LIPEPGKSTRLPGGLFSCVDITERQGELRMMDSGTIAAVKNWLQAAWHSPHHTLKADKIYTSEGAREPTEEEKETRVVTQAAFHQFLMQMN